MRDASYFKIGLFVIGATVLLVGGTIAFGAGALFRKEVLVETYFNESVQGLEVGSAVKFRGVKIGDVRDIQIASNYYAHELEVERLDGHGRYVVCIMAINAASFVKLDDAQRAQNLEDDTRAGLRIRLASLGLTGTKFLEADYIEVDPEYEVEVTWTPKNLYVPSAPATLPKILLAAERIADQLRDADLTGLLRNLNELVESVHDTVESLQLAPLVDEGSGFLVELRSAAARADDLLADPALTALPSNLAATASSLRESSASLVTTLDRVAAMFAGEASGPVLDDVAATLASLRKTSDELPAMLADLRDVAARLDRAMVEPEANLPEILSGLQRVVRNLETMTAITSQYPARVFGDPPPPATPGK